MKESLNFPITARISFSKTSQVGPESSLVCPRGMLILEALYRLCTRVLGLLAPLPRTKGMVCMNRTFAWISVSANLLTFGHFFFVGPLEVTVHLQPRVNSVLFASWKHWGMSFCFLTVFMVILQIMFAGHGSELMIFVPFDLSEVSNSQFKVG